MESSGWIRVGGDQAAKLGTFLLGAVRKQMVASSLQGLPGADVLRLALLGLAALIAVSLGVSFLFQTNVPGETPVSTGLARSAPEPLNVARRKIEVEIDRASPDYARFFERLHALLPTEYDRILDGFAKEAGDKGDVSNVDWLVSQAVSDIRRSNGVLATKADAAALSHIFDMQLAMMQALGAKDARLCVDFLYGKASQAFFAFAQQNRRLVADMANAGLDAIGSGRANQIQRQPPSDADFNALESAMKAQGLTDAEVAAMLDGKTPDPPIPDARMCAAGQIYLKSLAALPEPARLRIYGLAVELMAGS